MIEAELKARVRDPDQLRELLGGLAAGENSTYHDTYYDWPGRQLTSAGRELRLRVVQTAGRQRALLTYKEPAVDSASGSKPEHETEVADPAAIDATLRGVGLACLVAFEKRCTNYRFAARDRDMLATVVQVPELDGTFLELETMTDEAGIQAARQLPRTVVSGSCAARVVPSVGANPVRVLPGCLGAAGECVVLCGFLLGYGSRGCCGGRGFGCRRWCSASPAPVG